MAHRVVLRDLQGSVSASMASHNPPAPLHRPLRIWLALSLALINSKQRKWPVLVWSSIVYGFKAPTSLLPSLCPWNAYAAMKEAPSRLLTEEEQVEKGHLEDHRGSPAGGQHQGLAHERGHVGPSSSRWVSPANTTWSTARPSPWDLPKLQTYRTARKSLL